MSVHVVSWVLRNSETRLGARLVLLALADHAHDDGTSAYPAVASLAAKARITPRHCHRILRELVAEGHIEAAGKGPKGTISYTVLLGGAESAGGDKLSEGGVTSTTPEVQKMSPEPSQPSFPSERTPDGVRPLVAHYFDTAKKLVVYAPNTNAPILVATITRMKADGVTDENIRGGIELMLGRGCPPHSLPHFVTEWMARNRKTPREVDTSWRKHYDSVPSEEGAQIAKSWLEEHSSSASTADGPPTGAPAGPTPTFLPETPTTTSDGDHHDRPRQLDDQLAHEPPAEGGGNPAEDVPAGQVVHDEG